MKRLVAIILVAGMSTLPVATWAEAPKVRESSWWTETILEENSLTASLLYIPVFIGSIPVRIIEGIVNPVPVSQGTIPPPPHRRPH